MGSDILAPEIRDLADHHELQKGGSDSMSRFIVDSLPDLDETVGECVKVSLEGAGGLGIEHWVGEEARDRPFHSADHFSYRALLGFVTRNSERSSDSQDFLHYISPWYEWALGTAESKLLVTLMSRPEFAGAAKEKLAGQIREITLRMEKP
jgi:hypothetical protein